MKKSLGLSCLALVLSLASSHSATLYSQDFSDGAAAAAQFTTHGQATFTFNNGNLDIASLSSFSYARTNAGNSFIDDGTSSILYTVNLGYAQNSGARVGGMVFRLDSTGATENDTNPRSNGDLLFGSGYNLEQYWDGTNTVLILNRYNVGTPGAAATEIYSGVNLYSALASDGPNDLSVIVTNTATSVDFSISYGGVFLTNVSDTSALRLTSGQGIGVSFGNNGGGVLNADFYSLSATTIPEPSTTALAFGAIIALGFMVHRARRTA